MTRPEFLTSANLALIVGTFLLLSPGQVLFKSASSQLVPGSNETHIGVGIAFACCVVASSCCSRVGIASLVSAMVLLAAVLLPGKQRHPLVERQGRLVRVR